MRKTETLLTSSLMAIALAGAQDAALGQEPSGALVGSVFMAEDNSPLSDVRVRIMGTELQAVSDSLGSFRLEGVPAGEHTLTVSYLNMVSDVAGSVAVALADGETVWLSIELEVTVVPVPELVVRIERADNVGKMAGFDHRRATGFGSFITRDEIERARPSRLSQLFYAVAGVRVVPAPNNDILGTRLVSARAGGINCYMELFLDGIRQPSEGFNIDLLPPEDIEAIEVYAGSSRTPAIFARRGSPCGAVVIWTRDPTRQDREP
jgi:iron complex outermembrane receptor protein